MKPIIGISCAWSEETWGPTAAAGGYDYVGRGYVEAIYRAGGIPVLIPPVADEADLEEYALATLKTVDGLYFSGGGNVTKRKSIDEIPTLYEQQPTRARWEDYLLKLAYKEDVPTLGVCRGYQMMAVAFGGEIDTVRLPEHKQTVPFDQGIHDVSIAAGSVLAQIVGEERWHVNSIHVERVKRVPDGFAAVAWADDGSIEALEAQGKAFFMGTQFHPELMPDDPLAQRVINAFVKVAGMEC